MKIYDFRDAIETEFERRHDEIILLKRMIDSETDSSLRETKRRVSLLILYAHLEGFCVYALREYVKAINIQRIVCRDANSAVVAGAWHAVFKALADGDQKCDTFKTALPGDDKLHQHWRRRHFIDEFDDLFGRIVELDAEVINSESNLKPVILKRNLFVVGLNHKIADEFADQINKLLSRRNPIAHGEDVDGVSDHDYLELEDAFFEVCTRLIDELVDAFEQFAYLKSGRQPEFQI
jgi:hypothetical protein